MADVVDLADLPEAYDFAGSHKVDNFKSRLRLQKLVHALSATAKPALGARCGQLETKFTKHSKRMQFKRELWSALGISLRAVNQRGEDFAKSEAKRERQEVRQ